MSSDGILAPKAKLEADKASKPIEHRGHKIKSMHHASKVLQAEMGPEDILLKKAALLKKHD
jgi:hypothetical protein